jgi:hypothetical protein
MPDVPISFDWVCHILVPPAEVVHRRMPGQDANIRWDNEAVSWTTSTRSTTGQAETWHLG